jgi:putative transposase
VKFRVDANAGYILFVPANLDSAYWELGGRQSLTNGFYAVYPAGEGTVYYRRFDTYVAGYLISLVTFIGLVIWYKREALGKKRSIVIKRHITAEELLKRIKSPEKDVKVLQRLYFIKYRYEGVMVEDAAKRVEISKPVAYIWQERWNKEGIEGLKPKFAGGKPSKLTDNQKEQMKEILNKRDDWTTEEIRKLISEEFMVEYTLKQIRIILRKFGMKLGKPYPHDYRRPDDAEDIL